LSAAKGKERTLTAVRSPFADGETRSVPVIFVIGSAKVGPPAPRRWWILPSLSGGEAGDEVAWLGRASGTDADAAAEVDGLGLLLHDPLVSGRHARLLRDPHQGGLAIEDLGSKNGTFVGLQRISGPTAWPEGAVVFAGDHALCHRMVSPNELLALEEEATAPLGPVATASPELAVTAQKLRRWAAGGQELLLCGETGVGKEVYARAVHAASGRTGAFVALNCAALPRELVESELFGYRAGAHSTARGDKPGLIERAQGGTLFLDEIGELPQEGQAKLLRFLQDRELTPLGGQKSRRIEVSIIAATNQEVKVAGALRADLVGRLGAAPVVLPPLRRRREDLGALCRHFLGQLLPGRASAVPGFEGPAFRALCLHEFPLNVRELEKVLAAAVALTQGKRPIVLGDLPAAFAHAGQPVGGGRSGDTLPLTAPSAAAQNPLGRRPPSPGPSPAELEALLARHGGNVAEVSRALGRQRAAVWRWIKRFGLGVQQHRGGGDPGDPDGGAAVDDSDDDQDGGDDDEPTQK
jgi:DNA-binding NtrC family response regulator